MAKYDDISSYLNKAVNDYRVKHMDGRNLPSLESVAEKIGVSKEALSNWLDGSSMPSFGNALKLANLLDISLDEMAGHIKAAE